MSKKVILFLSALDFKEKSIQVIRKTPEAYVDAGWRVIYAVARDDSKFGTYSYEAEINPRGIDVFRFRMPFTEIYDRLNNRFVRLVMAKFRAYISVLRLAVIGAKVLRKHHVDVVYGYEVYGVLAVNLLKIFGLCRGKKIVSRFQGTFFFDFIEAKRRLKIALNWEHLLALWLPSDLCIMTNDGTRGDKALEAMRSRNTSNMRFWVNGVDAQSVPFGTLPAFKAHLEILEGCAVILTVCRLESWKRVDRGIRVVSEMVHKHAFLNLVYYVVGEGDQKKYLQQLAEELRVKEYVRFVGAVPNEDVKKYLAIADIFLSTYESSNVGNPLLEAIRAKKAIFTLNNGDTGSWIQHRINGFIYDEPGNFIPEMAQDMVELVLSSDLMSAVIRNVSLTEKEKLWTWSERLEAELAEVNGLTHSL